MAATQQAIEWARAAASGAAEKLASEIIALDVSDHVVITDVFVVASAPSDRQVKAVVDEVEERLRQVGAKPIRREGMDEARWVLLDYGDIVVHVQQSEDREFYALERLWKDCPVIDVLDADGDDAVGPVEDEAE